MFSSNTTSAELEEKVTAFVKRSFNASGEEVFNLLALEIFRFQYQNIPIYTKFCKKREATPDTVTSWKDIPPISTAGFRLFDLFAKPSHTAERTFSTSGTTQDAQKGRSFFSETGLRIMQQAIIENALHFFLPDGLRLRFLIIAPAPDKAPHMIMAYGMEILKKSFGLPGSRFLVNENGFDSDELEQELRKAEKENIPVALIGASLGLLTFIEHCMEKGVTFKLPKGSRTLDAGGYKGRTKSIERDKYLSLVQHYLGIEREWSINLLGMTELGSQFYDNTLQNHYKGSEYHRYKENPPWTRTLVIDPGTLREVPLEYKGILCHIDLTNIERIMAIQTDDIGKRLDNGFEILGRAQGAEARGCSLSIEEIATKYSDTCK
jgi:hypothetical protein